ncbi:MFS transporter [Allosphingosinicella vermicomposti]|uniref:MFS transporter n=1 Tax=Allosphingosinicella vermicomposti TaxID=614671 RepID=UPI000D107594|nr:MFS transporter [Allosphingosinicella vermicomposti]
MDAMRQKEVKGFGLSRERFALLFLVMMVAAAGNTAMQSLLPAIGRQLGIPDLLIAVAFSLSALLWVVTAPRWARQADRRGRRALMRLGLTGFISAMLVCGLALAAGISGLIGPLIVFAIFITGRSLYGGFGSAAPPAVQAYIAARTDGPERTNALAAIASSFGLGTIIGPAVAPLFIFEPLGLVGPLIVFAGIGVLVLVAIVTRLPDDTPRNPAFGQLVEEPMMGGTSGDSLAREGIPTVRFERSREAVGENEDARLDFARHERVGGEVDEKVSRLRWRDPRVFPWLAAGIIGGHGQAAMLGVIGFLVIDRLAVPIDHAQQSIAVVLMAGAAAALLAQWWLIPQLRLPPRALIVWGSLVAAAGAVVTGLAGELYGLTLGFALASVGFGLFRPGFTSGASLGVSVDEQNAVAGMVTSVNGVAYVAAPAIGVALYGVAMPLPFFVTAAVMIGLVGWLTLSPLQGRE